MVTVQHCPLCAVHMRGPGHPPLIMTPTPAAPNLQKCYHVVNINHYSFIYLQYPVKFGKLTDGVHLVSCLSI